MPDGLPSVIAYLIIKVGAYNTLASGPRAYGVIHVLMDWVIAARLSMALFSSNGKAPSSSASRTL